MSSAISCRLTVLAFFYCVLGGAADWLTSRGDWQHSGFQPDEKVLTVETAKKLRLLWTRRLNLTGEFLTDPIMLGPIITGRGVKELIFSKDTATVYAVDTDLGTLFWTRTISGEPAPERASRACVAGVRISPVMKPSSKQTVQATSPDDSYSDGNKPMYVGGPDNTIHVLRPRTGGDLRPPFQLPRNLAIFSLEVNNQALYALCARTCGAQPDRVWSRGIGASGLEVDSPASTGSYMRRENATMTKFNWNGQSFNVGVTRSGEPVLKTAASETPLFGSTNVRRLGSGIASWQNTAGERWIYTSNGDSVSAFKVKRGDLRPTPVSAWSVHGLQEIGAPTVANGVVYFLSRSDNSARGHLILHALASSDGQELFNSHEQITSSSSSGNLAVANGHVCFSASEATLTCFGLPFAM